jgi:hypothetical protein
MSEQGRQDSQCGSGNRDIDCGKNKNECQDNGENYQEVS